MSIKDKKEKCFNKDSNKLNLNEHLIGYNNYPLLLNKINFITYNNNPSFLYLLKSGNITFANNKLFEIDIIDKKSLKALLKIKIEDKIRDLCEGKNGILFILTKNINIIKISDNNYCFLNKIELVYDQKINFIYTLSNKEIISPSNENNYLYIWEDDYFFDISENNISKNKIINKKIKMENKIYSLLKWDEKFLFA